MSYKEEKNYIIIHRKVKNKNGKDFTESKAITRKQAKERGFGVKPLTKPMFTAAPFRVVYQYILDKFTGKSKRISHTK